MASYISELRYTTDASGDFIEVAIPTGTDVSGYTIQIYDDITGTLVATYGLGTSTQTISGNDVYVVDNGTPGWAGIQNGQGYALVGGSGTVEQFISFGGTVTAVDGDAAGQTSTNKGEGDSEDTGSMQSDDSGSSYFIQNSANPGTIPCYAPGTLIDTPDGPRAVETLKPGDLVMTLDHGPKPIPWTHSGDHPLEEAEVDAKPVQIKAGALGRNLPANDLIVSPQHRILVGGAGQLHQVFAAEAFAPAKSLTSVPGIRHMKGKTKITWIHFACDRHEVVTANGCLSESLLLGPMVVNGLTATVRQAVTDIFGPAPTPNSALNGPPARECLTVGAVRRQIAKHLKEKGQLLAKEIKKWVRDLAMEQYEAERLREAAASAQPSETAIRVA